MQSMEKNLKNDIKKEAVVSASENAKEINGVKTVELIIREGDALPAKVPVNVNLSGTIESPLLFLEKRVSEIDQKKAHVVVDREALAISLFLNETDPYGYGTVKGQITSHPMFKKFGINSGNYITTHQMGDLFKMNRSAFDSIATAMNLVHELKNFKAKIHREMEKANNDRGDRKLLMEQTVNSNVPEKFNLTIPVFKGMPKETFEVEVYFNPEDLSCTLISPSANDILESTRDTAIDSVLSRIREVSPEIVIIEK